MARLIVIIVSLLLIVGCMATLAGCDTTPIEKPKPLPMATAGVEAVSSSVGSTVAHVESAAKNAGTAHAEVMTALPLTVEPVAGHLATADQSLTTTESELKSALADLAAVQAELKGVKSSLESATKERVASEKALSEAVADAKKYKDKYDSQWFAGKFWKMVWVVSGAGIVLTIIVIVLNAKTDLFVVPFAVIGKAIVSFFVGTFKAVWGVLSGVWGEISSLWKKKPTT